MNRLWSSLLIVVSSTTWNVPEWRGVVEALKTKHADMEVSVLTAAPAITDSLAGVRERKPRYLAYVMRPEEVDAKTVRELRRQVAAIDSDPFDDAVWGIVTGPDAAAAQRIASSSEPKNIETALSTTGVGTGIVPGRLVKFSDGYPAGEWTEKSADGTEEKKSSDGDISRVFAKAWAELDPQFLLTSSHASQINLEMPFSRGNIISAGGKFSVCPDLTLIDYTTGQFKADADAATKQAKVEPLAAPTREKIWLAAGNCLIADARGSTDSMLMTALGFGKVNQFVGYVKTTWFGEIGWNTWKYFGTCGLPLNESWYFANQNLTYALSTTPEAERNKENEQFVGRCWDWDGTAFYGDPVQSVTLPGAAGWKGAPADFPPPGIIFPDSKPDRKLVSAPEGWKVFVADDFALVLKHPHPLPENWREQLVFTP